jgi:Tfp pilus assembly protein PilF
MLRYQFGPFLAYFNSLRTDDLLALAKFAATITPNSEEARLWLGWAHFRNGDREAAKSEFLKALEENNYYADAQYALNYLLSN